MFKQLGFHVLKSILYWEASLFRSRYHGPVIAITGSVGKTSTKEAVGLIVKKEFGDDCFVSPKSFNTALTVPLTMLGFQREPSSLFQWGFVIMQGLGAALFGNLPQCMVLELGADHRGDIAHLGRLTRPTLAIITGVSESHSQFLGSLEEIRQEKNSLLEFVSLDGAVLLNGDDEYLAKVRVHPTQKKELVRLHGRADYFASGIKVGLEGTEAILHHANRTQRLHIKRFGAHHLYSVLFAAAVADNLSISPTKQLQAFKEIKPLPGRGMLIRGKKSSLILDESYNAQPEAMKASLNLLKVLPAKRRVAILGDMRELREPEGVHRAMGKLARESADYIIAVGPLSKNYKADEWFASSEEAYDSALRQLAPGVIVLVKGSQNTIRLERLVKLLMRDPSMAKQLLVRQELEWAHKP